MTEEELKLCKEYACLRMTISDVYLYYAPLRTISRPTFVRSCKAYNNELKPKEIDEIFDMAVERGLLVETGKKYYGVPTYEYIYFEEDMCRWFYREKSKEMKIYFHDNGKD